MERYTIEDVEVIRKKSGISYEEAVNLLEYHNGNLAKALIDLERNGKLDGSHSFKGFQATIDLNDGKKKAMSLVQKLYNKRFVVRKGKTDVVNLSLLYMIPFALFAPHAAVVSLVLIFVFGYRIKFQNGTEQFSDVRFDQLMKNAAQNVKDTFSDITTELTHDSKKAASEPVKEDRSYYQPSENRPSAPVMQTPSAPQAPTVPVIVNCDEDGSVKIEADQEGYSEATVE